MRILRPNWEDVTGRRTRLVDDFIISDSAPSIN